MPGKRQKYTNGLADLQGKVRIQDVSGTPSFVEPMRAKAQAANLSWEDNGDGSWSIVFANVAPMRAQGNSFGVFWQDDDGEHYTACTVEKT